MYTGLTDTAAIEAIAESGWNTYFEVYDEGKVSAFLDTYGDVVAALRWSNDGEGIQFFETRYHSAGHGERIIRQLQASRPALYLSGDLDNAACARFWRKVGLLESGAVELFDGTKVVV